MSAELLSIQVGLPKRYGTPEARHPIDRPWFSAISKHAVEGQVWVGRVNVSGDAQADLEAHGGPEKAVLVYAAAHYPAWRSELKRPELPFGAFGENFTVSELDESSVCIGDVYEAGGALIQVSQPRVPCFKLAYRWRIKDLTARVKRSHRPWLVLPRVARGLRRAGADGRACRALLPRLDGARDTYRRGRTQGGSRARMQAGPLRTAHGRLADLAGRGGSRRRTRLAEA